MLKKIVIILLILAVIGAICAVVHNLKVAHKNKKELSAFAQKQNSLRMNSTQHIHYQCSIGRAHTEVDDSDIVCCRRYHVSIFTFYLHAEHLRKHAHILIEIRQQNKLPERIQTLARITRQPVCYYVFFCSFHTQINPAKNVPKPILFPL